MSGSGERPTATEYLHLLRDVVRAIDPRRAIAADVELDLIRARCIVMGFDSFDDLYESWQAGRFALDK